MEIFIAIILFLLGLVLIIKGGDFFVDSASWMSEKSGIPKIIVGATIVSIGTTLPEVITSAIGSASGSQGLAIGNALGSVIMNTSVIMAIIVIFAPAVIKRKEYMFKSLYFLGITVLLTLLLLDQKINTLESILMLLCSLGFLLESYLSAVHILKLNKEQEVEKEKVEKKDIIINISKFILGGVAIFFGAKLLVDKGIFLASKMGVSEYVIGLTFIAIGTSLPELVVTITSLKKKKASLSMGNIIGANILNITLVLPISAFVSGGTLVLDSMKTVYFDLPIILGIISIILIPTLIRGKFSRWQGIATVSIYIIYTIILFTGIV